MNYSEAVDVLHQNWELMVAKELVRCLLALIFAFPHVPDHILRENEDDESQ